ncbi:MAG: hypothetical protein AB1716_13260 [Planctomycetota bacterium]
MHGSRTAALILLLSAAGVGQAALLWDNFNAAGPGGFDGRYFVTSEQDAVVPSGSGAADDAVFSQPVTLQKLRWAGCYLPQYTYTAKVFILDSGLNETVYDAQPITILETYGTVFGGYTAFNAEVPLPEITLPAGRYLFGVQLINRTGTGALGPGRHMILSTGNGTLRGSGMGMVKAADFGYPNWIPISEWYGLGITTDYAFQVYGDPVPEPASLFVLLAGPLVALLRRR